MTENEKDLIVQEESLPAAEEAAGKKPGLVRGARDFIENTFATLKGKDMNQAVEEFTSEMTLVAEGLSEDQEKLRRDVDQLAAQQTMTEEKLSRGAKEQKTALEEQKKRMDALEKRLDAIEKAQKEVEAKIKEIIAQVGASSIKDMGKVMGAANKTLAGLSDGRTISTIVKKLLS